MEFLPEINGKYVELAGRFTLPWQFGMEENCQDIHQVFEERLQKLGRYRIDASKEKIIIWHRDPELEKEANSIRIENGKVRICASSEKGYSNALTTLFQMLVRGHDRKTSQGSIANCELSDKPRFEMRGMMLDVSRHFFSIKEIKKIIEQCALLKLNHFHWHLSDDQGFRIQSIRFPELNTISSFRKLSGADPVVLSGASQPGERYGGYYTQEEIREVIAYASARQIEVIPEIDLPGHSSAILAAFPWLTCSGKPLKVKSTFGVHERIFCAGKTETYDFLYELLDELCELFPSAYFHLGGDEAPKGEWQKCPKCNSLMKREELADYEKLQTWFTGKLVKHIKEKGKTPIVWNESAIAGDLDKSAVVQYWEEMAPGPSYIVPEVEKGRKLLLSNGNQFYCCNTYAEMPLGATLMYEPEIKGVKIPVENVLGIEAPMWTEWTPEDCDIEQLLYPRLLAVAECGWTLKRYNMEEKSSMEEKQSMEDFMNRAEHYLSYEALNLLKPMPWEKATIKGTEALREIAASILSLGKKYRDMSEGEVGEPSGKAEAVFPENTQPIDKSLMTRIFIEDKMKAAYSSEEIELVIKMVEASEVTA